jgi:colanic acid biosynthesis protein WcaH
MTERRVPDVDQARFLSIVEHTPLVSIDLIVRNGDGEVLVGRRVNEPAKGTWFVPGGRIWKGEDLDQAFDRIARVELGTGSWARNATTMIGAHTHIYPTNFAERSGIDTHYVVLAHLIDIGSGSLQLPPNSIRTIAGGDSA